MEEQNIPKKSEKSVEASEPTAELKPSPKDAVKVKVLIGTLVTEDGVFSRGDIIEVSRKRAEAFDKTSVRILV